MTQPDKTEDVDTEGSLAMIDKKQLKDLADSFASWMLISGYAHSTVQVRKSVFRSAIERMGYVPTDSDDSLGASNDLASAISSGPAWQRPHSVSVSDQFIDFMDDLQEMSATRTFSFTEINPGMGALGLAALNAGGVPNGAEYILPLAQPTYVSNFGRGSLEPAIGDVQLVLANLPFSLFVSGSSLDPEIGEILRLAGQYTKSAQSYIFRIDWTIGSRMGLDPASYVEMIKDRMKGWDFHAVLLDNQAFTPMEGKELFVVCAKRWELPFRAVAAGHQIPKGKSLLSDIEANRFVEPDEISFPRIFPDKDAMRIDADYWHDPSAAIVKTKSGNRLLVPAEISRILGFPETYALLTDAETAYHLLGSSVVVPLAERVIRGVLRSVELV